MKNTTHWFVYMLECQNGSFYTGSTDDLIRRFEEHRKGTGKSKYTRSFKPVGVAQCWELAGTRGKAMKIERLVQGMNRSMKNEIVAFPERLAGVALETYGDDFGIVPYVFDPSGHVLERERDITRYVPGFDEWKIRNPYLEEMLSLLDENKKLKRNKLTLLLNEKRSEIICRYAFSIPTIDIIEEIAGYSPLVEIGAGSGYWAMCLGDAGADVIAYDKRPPDEEIPWDYREGNQWFDDTWSHVHEGDESMAGRCPERTLFICWPPIHDTMAVNALRCYREAGGKTVVFIGSTGASADDEFFRELEKLRMIRSIRLWSWPGSDERMLVYDLTHPWRSKKNKKFATESRSHRDTEKIFNKYLIVPPFVSPYLLTLCF
jgi:putative endonuclease